MTRQSPRTRCGRARCAALPRGHTPPPTAHAQPRCASPAASPTTSERSRSRNRHRSSPALGQRKSCAQVWDFAQVWGPGMPDDDGDLTADELGEYYDAAAENVWDWLEHPCDMHLWYVGVSCNVPGYGSRLVL